MPIKIGVKYPCPEKVYVDLVPDVSPDTPSIPWPVMFAQAPLLEVPQNWDALTPEEKNAYMQKYRFQGIKCRNDIKDRTIPITKQTLDIP